MRKKVYIVELTDEERQHLRTLIHGGTAHARMINRAQILLHADEGAPQHLLATPAKVEGLRIAISTAVRSVPISTAICSSALPPSRCSGIVRDFPV